MYRATKNHLRFYHPFGSFSYRDTFFLSHKGDAAGFVSTTPSTSKTSMNIFFSILFMTSKDTQKKQNAFTLFQKNTGRKSNAVLF